MQLWGNFTYQACKGRGGYIHTDLKLKVYLVLVYTLFRNFVNDNNIPNPLEQVKKNLITNEFWA